jgi:hypothetical protein
MGQEAKATSWRLTTSYFCVQTEKHTHKTEVDFYLGKTGGCILMWKREFIHFHMASHIFLINAPSG